MFKIYLSDVGILTCMSEIKYPDIITPEKFHKVVNEIIYPPYMFAPQRKASRKASIGNLELYFEDNKTKLLNDTIK